jgi:CHAT domain-containing protein
LRHTGDPHWVDLGDAQTIDDAARAFAASLADPTRDDVRTKARALDALVMQPIRKILGDVPPRLFISPDGALNLIPFGALMDEHGRFLLETRSISYLSSGRDLAKRAEPPRSSGDVILANPDFGDKSVVKPSDEARGSPLSRAFFEALPGTADEARALEKRLPHATVLTNASATKKAVEALHRPRILHIATHGFFLSPNLADQRTIGSRGLDLDISKPISTPATTNPLLMAGLALARANDHGSKTWGRRSGAAISLSGECGIHARAAA